MLGDPARELAFVEATLDKDAKNYHTWAYRQWVLSYFGGWPGAVPAADAPGAGKYPALWDGELAYTERMMERDVRNNSAYNHRWFCVFGRQLHGKAELPSDLEHLRDSEIAYVRCTHARFAWRQIDRAPNNASAWSYLRG